MSLDKDENEKRSVEIVKELTEIDAGGERRREEWEEANKLCLTLAEELSHAQLAGLPSSKLRKMRESLQRAQWVRDRSMKGADTKRSDLRRELATLTGKVVEDAIQELEEVLAQKGRKHDRKIIKTIKFLTDGADKKRYITLSNDQAFSQITEKVMEGRRKVRDMRERASIPQIKEYLKSTLEEILTISMEPVESEVDGALYFPLDKAEPIKASLKETFEAEQDGKLSQLDHRISMAKKDVQYGGRK